MRNEKKEHMIRIISKIAWEINTVHPDKAFMLLLGKISAYNEILRRFPQKDNIVSLCRTIMRVFRSERATIIIRHDLTDKN